MNEALCTALVRQRAVSYDPSVHYQGVEWMPCERCGDWSRNCERHHRLFRSRGGLWSPSNVVLICQQCHILATAERLEPGWNVASHEVPAEVPVTLWYCESEALLDDEGGYRPAA